MKCRFGFNLLFALCFAWLLVPFVSNAQSVSGYNTYYIQHTSNGTLPDNYSSTVSGLAFPTTTYTQIPAYQNQTYNVIRAMDLQFPSVEFTVGSTYTFTINFDYGSYIYPNWPNNQAHPFSVRSCPHGTCSITYTWQNDSTHQSVNTLQLKLVHKANANQTGKTFGIGPMTTNTGLFYNAYSSQQGIRINSATVDIVEDPNYQNTQDIINNNNQNTQTIINNQNANTQQQIESQKVCISYDTSTLEIESGYLLPNGTENIASGLSGYWGISKYISLKSNYELTILQTYTGATQAAYCFYGENKSLISCSLLSSVTINEPISIPSNSFYFRTSLALGSNLPQFRICKNGNQALNDTLTDSSVNDNKIYDFFDSLHFYDNNQFSSLITSPISFLNSLNDTCQPINLQLFGKTVSVPCGTTVFWERDLPNISTFRVFWNVLFGGALIYSLGLLLVKNISDVFDPTKDEIGGLKL